MQPLTDHLRLHPTHPRRLDAGPDLIYCEPDCIHVRSIKPRFFECKQDFLRSAHPRRDNKAMLEPIEMAERIREAIGSEPGRRDEIARLMDVSRPAVDGWCKTGLIDYKKLPKLAHFTGVGLPYFWPEMGTQETAALTADQWRAAKLVEAIPAERRAAFFSTGRALGEPTGPSTRTRKSA
jgi:hypothetical protein